MKYYRILFTNKETERQVYSPFVFKEEEALRRCTVSNITGAKKGKHIPILVKKPREMEIWNKEVHKPMGPDEIDMHVRRIEMLNSRQGRSE